MSKLLKVVAVLTLGAFLAAGSPSLATEGGGTIYALGSEDFVTAVLPPPGLYFLNYAITYSASTFVGADGKSLIPNFRVDATADALRFVNVTDHRLFGGSYAMQVIIPVVAVNVQLPQGFQHKTGVGDITITPLAIGWHSPHFHTVVAVDFNVPTGDYVKGEIANVGRNYFNAEPLLAVSYLGKSFEASTKFMYDLNGINTLTNYKSGNEFHLDYAAGYRYHGAELGVGGYFYNQVSDDTQNGVQVRPDGFRGKAFAIGPVFSCNVGHVYLVAKYEHEANATYRPLGNKYVLRAVTRL